VPPFFVFGSECEINCEVEVSVGGGKRREETSMDSRR
jgi:hypothetical protein